ncbi:MAG: CAP domain-containing protein [Nitrososphaerales archaeon]
MEQFPPAEPKKRNWLGLVSAIMAVVLILILLLYFLPSLPLGNFFSPHESTSTFIQNPSGNLISTNSSSASNVDITYPSNYAALENYTLSIIDQNRTSSGLNPVTSSSIPSGQQHADSMLQNNYFSHWDTQGFKPYMRYSLLNGTGFVEENVAYEFSSFPTFTSIRSVESVIGDLEWQMMNNDSVCCANGHRDNILNQYHDRVSIGIAYSAYAVYFVEDFETYLVNFITPITQGSTVVLEGNASQAIDPTSVEVFYDQPPAPLTSADLNANYSTPYGEGTFLGGVIPPCNALFQRCSEFRQGVTVEASAWQAGGSGINIKFSLDKFVQSSGNGVYTVYLTQGDQNNPEYLTSISIFVSS